MDFSRHWLYIDKNTQAALGRAKILVAGIGIGSIFAEIAVRMGIRHLIIADGDTVAEHNITRQNYVHSDVGSNKVDALKKRLLSLNQEAQIRAIPTFLNEASLSREIPQVDYVLNTIDFDSQDYISCSRLCRQHEKIEFFPLNLGYAAVVFTFNKNSPIWDDIFRYTSPQDLKMQIIAHLAASGRMSSHLGASHAQYLNLDRDRPECDPQLAVSSYLVASMLMTQLIRTLKGEACLTFPDFHYLDAMSGLVADVAEVQSASQKPLLKKAG